MAAFHWITLSLLVVTNHSQLTATSCASVKIEGSAVYWDVDGEYSLMYRCSHLNNTAVYQQTRQYEHSGQPHSCSTGQVYVYFYRDSQWQGWVVGWSPCSESSSSCARAVSSTSSPTDTHNWTEYDQQQYITSDINVTCQDALSNVVVILTAIACTLLVLLLSLAPLLWVCFRKKKTTSSAPNNTPVTQVHQQGSSIYHQAELPKPPPYSAEPPPIYTITANNHSNSTTQTESPPYAANQPTNSTAANQPPVYTTTTSPTADTQPQTLQPPSYDMRNPLDHRADRNPSHTLGYVSSDIMVEPPCYEAVSSMGTTPGSPVQGVEIEMSTYRSGGPSDASVTTELGETAAGEDRFPSERSGDNNTPGKKVKRLATPSCSMW